MIDTTRMNLVVGEDIPIIMGDLAGGERKRGEWLTALVRDFADGKYILVSECKAQKEEALIKQGDMYTKEWRRQAEVLRAELEGIRMQMVKHGVISE